MVRECVKRFYKTWFGMNIRNHFNFEILQKIKQSNLRMIKEKLQRVMTSSLAVIIPRQAIMDNLVIKDDDRIDIGCESKSFLGLIARSVSLQKMIICGFDQSDAMKSFQ